MQVFGRIGLLIFTAYCLFGQSTAAPPAFEVASVKRNPVGLGPGAAMRETPGGIEYTEVPLKDVICKAYSLQAVQVSGGPDWLNSETYDIAAKAPPRALNAERRLMLQTLLAERFKLAVHREQKELPVYVLVVGKNGSSLHESEGANSFNTTYDALGRHLRGKMSALVLAGYLASQISQIVRNETGLKGMFDVALDFTPDDRAQTDDSRAPSIFTAVQEQLGIKLEARKAPVETLVIDHVEKPAEN
jgi:uncharacterized protein (TIGR03435 family)